MQSKGSFTGISCWMLLFHLTFRKLPIQIYTNICVWAWAGGWVRWIKKYPTLSLLGLFTSPQFQVLTVYTRKQEQAIKSDDVLRVGRSDSFLWGRIFSQFIQHHFQVPSKCEPAETSQTKIRLSSRRCGRKEWGERVEALFFFF